MTQTCKQPRNQNRDASELTRDKATFAPNVDIWENDQEIVLFSDIPGVEEDSLDIHFENRQLTIHGKVKARHEHIAFLGGEYGIGDFYRSFTIGDAIDSSRISAELKNGVLTLHLPKMEAVKPRKIPLRSA
jgi:HSP20 family molecular chaperone IbpA